MRIFGRNKQTIAGFLVACMVSATLSPAVTAYAEDTPGSIRYELGYGPGPDETRNPEGDYENMWSRAFHDGKIKLDTANDGTRAIEVNGYAGHRFDAPDSPFYDYAGIGHPDMEAGGSRAERPRFPAWDDDIWAGYKFQGWYKNEMMSQPAGLLDPAFPSGSTTTYYAKWTSDPDIKYTCHVRHEVLVGGGMLNLFPGDNRQAAAGEGFTAVGKMVPGFKITEVKHDVQRSRAYYDHGSERNGYEIKISIDERAETRPFQGRMPNEDVTVTYNYEPDTEQKFPLTQIAHFSDTSRPPIELGRTTEFVSAGTAIQKEPPAYDGYKVFGHLVTAGHESSTATAGVFAYEDIAGAGFSSDHKFSGYMPNQALTIEYLYVPDSSAATYSVLYIDENFQPIRDRKDLKDIFQSIPSGYKDRNPSEILYIPFPDLSTHGFSSDSTRVYGLEGVESITQNSGFVNVKFNASYGIIVVEYKRDIDNPNFYAQLSVRQGDNGSVSGDLSPRRMPKSEYSIDAEGYIETLADIIDAPRPHDFYKFDGWYEVDGGGMKISDIKLSELDLGNMGYPAQPADVRIRPFFVKDETEWKKVTLQAGANVSFDGSGEIKEAHYGDTIAAVFGNLPSPVVEHGYIGFYWIDKAGNPVNLTESTQIFFPEDGHQVYTLVARPAEIPPGYEALQRPNAGAETGNDGRGVISLKGSDVAAIRKYVVTDETGEILNVLTGQQIKDGNHFSGLDPGNSYKVYELSDARSPAAGDLVESIPAFDRSLPDRVLVPAIRDYEIVADPYYTGAARVIIEPVDAASEYALLDENFDVAADWTAPSGSPLQVVFDGLTQDSDYTVVVKPVGSSASRRIRRSSEPIYLQNWTAPGRTIPWRH